MLDDRSEALLVKLTGVSLSLLKVLHLGVSYPASWTGVACISLNLPVQLAHLATGAGQFILALAGVSQPVGLP